MAWKSTADNHRVQILQAWLVLENVKHKLISFNISQPVEALQLMACLHRIYVSLVPTDVIQDRISARV